MEVVVTTGALRHAKTKSDHHHQQTNSQFFYRLDILPDAQPTMSKHWMERITYILYVQNRPSNHIDKNRAIMLIADGYRKVP